MNRCATCRYWDRDDLPPGVEGVRVQARCLLIRHPEDMCDDGEGIPDKGHIAYVMDASGYTAKLETRGDFGCTLHEPLDPTAGG